MGCDGLNLWDHIGQHDETGRLHKMFIVVKTISISYQIFRTYYDFVDDIVCSLYEKVINRTDGCATALRYVKFYIFEISNISDSQKTLSLLFSRKRNFFFT